MAMTFQQLQEQVKLFGGYGTTDEPVIKAALTAAERDLYTSADRWSWLHKTVSLVTIPGTTVYPLPADLHMHERIRSATDGVEAPTFIAADAFGGDWESSGPASTASGVPESYGLVGGSIVFSPVPDTAITYAHSYWHVPALMSAQGDEPAVPPPHELILVYAALVHMAARDKDLAMVQFWDAKRDVVQADLRVANKFTQYQTVEKIQYGARYGGKLVG